MNHADEFLEEKRAPLLGTIKVLQSALGYSGGDGEVFVASDIVTPMCLAIQRGLECCRHCTQWLTPYQDRAYCPKLRTVTGGSTRCGDFGEKGA